MEGHWGMGSTVSSHASNRRFEVGTPGGKGKGAEDSAKELRRALADRIEDSLSTLLKRSEELLSENRTSVLAVAHALETYKTLSGEDVTAVIEGTEGAVVGGRPYARQENHVLLEEYHVAALNAHLAHNKPDISLPVLL